MLGAYFAPQTPFARSRRRPRPPQIRVVSRRRHWDVTLRTLITRTHFMSAIVIPPSPIPRPSSRNRSSTPQAFGGSLPEDPGAHTATSVLESTDNAMPKVALRQHMSSLKHSIRQQQAQLQTLESSILRGSRPLPKELEMELNAPIDTGKSLRRQSHERLTALSGPDSYLPLPRGIGGEDIQEGVPVGEPSRRAESPTRSLSRIPVSSVGHARALADDGNLPSATWKPNTAVDSSFASSSFDPNASSNSLVPPVSPGGRRPSLHGGNTTKVLADLQTGVMNARTALDNTKAQLRLSQRTVAQLTRQTEDLKEGRERLRLENENLNNVVSRKERLLHETLERARKAEAEASQLRSQLKQETSTSKKTLREMEHTLSESTALSQRCEREYVTLRDSVKGMVNGWKTETDALKEDVRRKEERWRKEVEEIGSKYRELLNLVQNTQAERGSVAQLRLEAQEIDRSFGSALRPELTKLNDDIQKSAKDTEEAVETARSVSMELARLRRLMRAAGRTSGEDTAS